MPFFQPDRKPHIIHPSGHPIDVMVSHNPLGAVKPLYFRLEEIDKRDLHLSCQRVIYAKTGEVS